MKKLQLRNPTSKSKQISNSDKGNKKVRLVLNNRLSKENIASFQRKEEKFVKRQQTQHLPSIKSITNKRSLTVTTKDDICIERNKCIQVQQNKKTLDLLAQRKSQQAIEIQLELIKKHAKQFLQLLQTKNIIQNNLQTISISSSSFQIILDYIITLVKNKEKSKIVLTNFINQSSFGAFIKSKGFEFESLSKSKKLKSLQLVSNIYEVYHETDVYVKTNDDVMSQFKQLKCNVVQLQRIKHQIGCSIAQEQKNLAQLQKKKDQLNTQVRCFLRETQRLGRLIEQNTHTLLKVQQKKKELQNFVNSQKNKIVNQASQYHKNIQIDMLQYEDYLRHHSLGKKQFVHSIYYSEISRLIKQQIDKLQFIISKDQKSIVTFHKIKHQYGLMIDQLHHAIDEKTKFIKEFCRIVFLWYQNYLTKNQYLGNLRKAFSLQVINIEKSKKKFCHEHESQMEKCQNCALIRMQLKKLFGFIDKLIELFGMGNSFY